MILEVICVICFVLSGVFLFATLVLMGVLCREGGEMGRVSFIISIILFIIAIITGSYSILQFLGVI